MSYTKGPLRVSGPSQGKGPSDDGGNYAIVEPGGIIIGEAFHRVGEDAYRDAEANARLWAKAPDLLAVAEEALQEFEALQEIPDTVNLVRKETVRRLRDALAGARGGE